MTFKQHFIKRLLTGILLLLCFIGKAQNADDFYLSSLDYASKGAFQQALININKSLSIDSSKAEYFLQRAEIQYQQSNYDKTIKDCYTVLRINPKDPEVYLLRGKVCVVTESYGGAILFFGKCINNTSDTKLLFNAHLNRGKALNILKRFPDAYKDLQTAYQIDSNSMELLLSLSETLIHLNKKDEALITLNRTIEADPNYAPTYYLLGELAQSNQDFPKAISAFEKYASLTPEDISAYNRVANIYLNNQQYEKAFQSLNSALLVAPSDPESIKIRGLIYIAQGKTEMGCNTLFRAMQLGYFEKYGYDLLDIYLKECEKHKKP